MSTGRSIFNERLIEKPKYRKWLEPCEDKFSAKCKVCTKLFDISNMGEAAIKSHSKGTKHLDLLKQKQKDSNCTLKDLFKTKSSDKEKSTATSIQPKALSILGTALLVESYATRPVASTLHFQQLTRLLYQGLSGD